MPRKTFALSERYYRRMLYGCAVLLSIAIVTALLFFVDSAYEQFRERQVAFFVNKREQIKSEVDRLSARVTQFALMYGRLQRFHAKDILPVRRYEQMVSDGKASSLSHANLTVVPFSLIMHPELAQDQRRLASLLLLLRQASALPMINPAEPGITLEGLICTTDRDFLAISPPLSESEKRLIENQGRRRFLEAMTAPLDNKFDHETVALMDGPDGKEQKVLWMGGAATGPLRREAVARLAVRIPFQAGDVATAVFSVPRDQFVEFFLRNENLPGVFVLDGKRDGTILAKPSAPDQAALVRQVRSHAVQIVALGTAMHYFHDDGNFFITQSIEGPGWNVVYAFNWRDIVKGLHGDFITGAFWALFALIFVWAATIYFDRFVIGPLREKALALIETQRFSQAIIDTLPVGIIVIAFDVGQVVLQNTVALRMLEYASIPLGDFYAQIVKECRLAEKRVPGVAERDVIEVQLRLLDGGVNHIDVAWSRTRFANQDVLLLGLIDMNMRKAHEALMLDAKSAADRANQAKSMFLAQVSHEIRTPLHGAIGHMELLAREELSSEQRKRVDLVRHSFDMLMGLVNDILDITKIESKAIRLKLAPINVNDLLEQCAQLFAPLAMNKGLQFFCLPDPELEFRRMGDEQRLLQILQNLVGNAVKFTEQGAVRLSARKVQRSKGNVVVRFEVSDSGIGISLEAQQRIFESLEQADDTISRRFGGTGLGLSLCRHLVELMQGTISLHSQLGEGSLFVVEVSLPECLQESEGVVPELTAPLLQGRVISLQCETPGLRNMLSAYLGLWGAQLHHNAPQSPVDFQVIAQDCAAGLGPEHAEMAEVTAVVMVADAARIPGNADKRLYVSAFDRRDWMRTLTGQPGARSLISYPAFVPAPTVSALDILVAEDDHVNLTLIKHQLQALGYPQVRMARDGADALAQWMARPPDILITDLGMPKLDGVALAREIRKRNPQAVIVAATAANPMATAHEFGDFSGVIYKPASLEDLQGVLSRVTAQERRGRAPDRPAIAPASLQQILMQAFRQSWPEERDKLREAIAAGEVTRVTRMLHRLQGGLQALGQEELAEASLALQQSLDRAEALALQDCQRWLGSVDQLYTG